MTLDDLALLEEACNETVHRTRACRDGDFAAVISSSAFKGIDRNGKGDLAPAIRELIGAYRKTLT